MQTDPIGYDDGINWYAYVGGDPVNGTDPTGTYICDGPRGQCRAVSQALERVREAAKDPDLSQRDRTKLQGALNFFGEEGRSNNVIVLMRPAGEILRQSGGTTSDMFTSPTPRGNVLIAISDKFSSFYEQSNGLRYRQTVAKDQRANALVHEADHGLRFQRGSSLKDYSSNWRQWERDAKRRGMIVNRAFGSQAYCEVVGKCNE